MFTEFIECTRWPSFTVCRDGTKKFHDRIYFDPSLRLSATWNARCVGTVTVRQQVLSAEGKNDTTHSSKTLRLWNLKKTASHEWYRKVAFCAGRKFSSEITSAKPQCELPFQPLESNSQGNLSFPCFGLHLLPFRSRTPRIPICSSNASRSGKIYNDNDDDDSKVSRAWSSAVQSCGHSTSNTSFFHNVNCHHKPLVSTGLLSCVCAANRHCNNVIAFFRDRKFMFRHVWGFAFCKELFFLFIGGLR